LQQFARAISAHYPENEVLSILRNYFFGSLPFAGRMSGRATTATPQCLARCFTERQVVVAAEARQVGKAARDRNGRDGRGSSRIEKGFPRGV
jgi:hypothetical protein